MSDIKYNEEGYTVQDVPGKSGLLAASDRDGNEMQYRSYSGHLYSEDFPIDVKGHLEAIDKFECREEDVILATYPKSGLHWMSNIVSMLVNKNTDFIGTPHFLDFSDIRPYSEMKSPRVLASHMWHDRLPRQIKEGKGKVINISRNPKDVAVSFHLFFSSMKWSPFTGTMAGYFKFFLNGNHHITDSWYDSVKSWEVVRKRNYSNVLLLNYEDTRRNFYDTIVTVSSFLGLNHDEDFLRAVEKRCSFDCMKYEALKPKDRWKDIAEGGILPIYRKGQIGDWKNHMTVAQSEEFDRVYTEKMAGVDITFAYE